SSPLITPSSVPPAKPPNRLSPLACASSSSSSTPSCETANHGNLLDITDSRSGSRFFSYYHHRSTSSWGAVRRKPGRVSKDAPGPLREGSMATQQPIIEADFIV